MILQALIEYYHRLEADPDQNIAPFGYSWQKISFVVVLEKDGSLHDIQDGRSDQDGKPRPTPVIVPGQSKPPGKGLNPCFLWDNAAYLLGHTADAAKADRATKGFEAFRDRHLALEKIIDDDAFAAACRFLRQWEPARAAEYPILDEVGPGFGVFRIRGQAGYVHQRPRVDAYWQQQLASAAAATADDHENEDANTGVSLIDGRTQPLARLHEPKIKGVAGGQSSGAMLVSFTPDAFTSYGKSQSYNAPVGVQDAFRYATALNHLLSDDHHRVRLGDMTVAFWSDRPNVLESAFDQIISSAAPHAAPHAEGEALTASVKGFLDALRRGAAHEGIDDPDAKFYILGLSPNAARISVRFWLVGTVQQFADRLAQYFAELEIAGARPDAPPLTTRRLLFETAREPKDIPPQLAGEMTRAILAGTPYPQALLLTILRRIRADQSISHPRAAILKACLTRNARFAGQNHEQDNSKEIPVSLNKDHPSPAYQMGRLFAAIEKTQTDALPGLNKTIRDGYLGTAATTPASVFPRLLRLHRHHIAKLEGGLKINREKLVQEIVGRIADRFPAHMGLEQQGTFYIGYYHQLQDFYTKRDDANAADTQEQTLATSEV